MKITIRKIFKFLIGLSIGGFVGLLIGGIAGYFIRGLIEITIRGFPKPSTEETELLGGVVDVSIFDAFTGLLIGVILGAWISLKKKSDN